MPQYNNADNMNIHWGILQTIIAQDVQPPDPTLAVSQPGLIGTLVCVDALYPKDIKAVCMNKVTA